MDDLSDILGGETLPAGRNQPPGLWSSIPDFAKSSLCIAGCLVLVIVLRSAYRFFVSEAEKRYRKATRRRHGIPDNDGRPFNMAYAAAVTARQERETQKTPGAKMRTSKWQSPPSPQQELRRNSRRVVALVPGGLDSLSIGGSFNDSSRNHVGATDSHDQYDAPPITISPPSIHSNDAIADREPDPANYAVPYTPNRVPRKSNKGSTLNNRPFKRALDSDDDFETERDVSKKTRVADEGLINQDGGYVDDIQHDELSRKRGSKKRLASSGDEDPNREMQTNRSDKRARKVPRDYPPEQIVDEAMDGVDLPSDSARRPRGKKRDRGDAGSTFGGDEDSYPGDYDEKHRERRRRRISSNKKHPRGQKRGRDLETVESDLESELENEVDQSAKRRSRKKRGRKTVTSDDDIDVDGVMVSMDPSCKGRAIGEEWERNGTRYKVGRDGARLRQALVKRKRPKYSMPVDSEHPDKDVMVEVIIETWMTEEQYNDAKERFELAWQDKPQDKTSIEPETPGNVHTPSAKGGKSLLWSSTTSLPESPVLDRRRTRHSIATSVGLHFDPFQPLPSQHNGKGRIISAGYSPIVGSTETPMLRQAKVYSKWEKQDLEAEAMSKIRQRLHDQKKVIEEQSEPAKPTVLAAVVLPSSSTISTSFPQPQTDKVAEEKAIIPPTTAATPAPPAIPKPSPFTPAATNFAATSSSSTPPVSLGNPSTASTTTPAPTSSIPNFFASKPLSIPTNSSAPRTTQSSTTSQASFGFPPASSAPAIASTAPKSSFTFATPSTLANALTEQKKVDSLASSATGPSLLSRVGPSTSATAGTTPGASAPTSGGSSFTFPTPGSAPTSDASKPSFTFGITNQQSSFPTTSAFGGTQPQHSFSSKPSGTRGHSTIPVNSAFGSTQPQYSSSTPLKTQGHSAFPATPAFGSTQPQHTSSSTPSGTQSSSTPNAQAKFSFGQQTKQDSAVSNTPNVTSASGVFGGTYGAFSSNTASSSNITSGQSGEKPGTAPEGSKPPTFSFGISKPSSTAFGGSAFSTTPGTSPASVGVFGSNNSTGAGNSTFKFGSGAFGTGAPTSTPFSSNVTETTPKVTLDSTSSLAEGPKSSFTFDTPVNPGQQSTQSSSSVPFGGLNAKFTFGTSASGARSSGTSTPGTAPTPSAFGFGNPSPFGEKQ